MEKHQALVKEHSKEPYNKRDAKEKRGGYSDKGDKKNSNDFIQHF
ncbi:MAG: hypothetical protein PVJ11_00440 [Syntrophobacterales bacterium]